MADAPGPGSRHAINCGSHEAQWVNGDAVVSSVNRPPSQVVTQ
jgi:hypothetical protein